MVVLSGCAQSRKGAAAARADEIIASPLADTGGHEATPTSDARARPNPGVHRCAASHLLIARCGRAPHADGSFRPMLGVLAEDPEAASTGAVTTAPRPALPHQAPRGS